MSAAKYEELAHPSAFKAGADRERRRIRRAQRDGINDLYRLWLTLHANKLGALADSLGFVRNALMHATRAKRSKSK